MSPHCHLLATLDAEFSHSRQAHTDRFHPLMTSAIPPSAQTQPTTNAAPASPGTTSPLPGAVPAQLPVRSYANATKTATQTPPTPAGASAPAQNAKSTTESPVNGVNPMAQGGSPAASAVPNGTPNHADHGRKPSVVISAAGTSGYTPNGGPVGQNGGRPQISFGSINSQASPLPQASVPYQSQTSSLPAPPRADPRVISPAHSPSPIPQPPASGGHRPPSSMQTQNNGMTFGSMSGDGEQVSFFCAKVSHDIILADFKLRCDKVKCSPAPLDLVFLCMSADSLLSPCMAIQI